MQSRDPLPALLKQVFGYESFRPLQREIMTASLDGRDTVAILPTGAGKSLCYQLPALVREGLTVVVSPLIALMKDQVDQLRAAGVAATFLNSTLEGGEMLARLEQLDAGNFKLLYVAPERLMTAGFLARMRRWRVESFAVDEAHCISEWGHDFRPEYRQIAAVRERFPGVPLLALTATATPRVQQDIVEQLKLHDPRVFIARFNRPNLSYRVIPKDKPVRQVWEFASARKEEPGIVYCQSRRSTEAMAAALARGGAGRGRVSRGPGSRGAFAEPGSLPAGRGADRLRDGRLRHGHQQTERALCDSRGSAEERRGLLSGNGPRRPRRAAGGLPAALLARRRDEAA